MRLIVIIVFGFKLSLFIGSEFFFDLRLNLVVQRCFLMTKIFVGEKAVFLTLLYLFASQKKFLPVSTYILGAIMHGLFMIYLSNDWLGISGIGDPSGAPISF